MVVFCILCCGRTCSVEQLEAIHTLVATMIAGQFVNASYIIHAETANVQQLVFPVCMSACVLSMEIHCKV
jgi:hypothetical protein